MRTLCGILWFLVALATANGEEKPNIILIFTDDHGWPDIGAAGIHADLKTPHLDKLAADGVRCTNGYVTAPQCVPSRGGLLVGRDQSRFGLESNKSPLDGFNNETTIAQRLRLVGYSTGQIGKWHLGPANEIQKHGFDDVYAKNANRPCFATFNLDGTDREPGIDDTKVYHLDACSQAAVSFIDRHAGKPFFLYLAYRAPHVPLDAPDKYLSRFPGEMPERRRQALAMISAMDDGVGLIREKLEEHNLTNNTLIFFIGDNGAPLKIEKKDAPGGGPGWDGSLNEPMNGEKGMLSEGGIRVPFLAAWPGTFPPDQIYDRPVISLDVAATAASLAGIDADEELDGVDLVPFFKGDSSGDPHKALFWRWESQSAIRVGDWKYLRGGSREYLYQMEQDPYESTNLAAQHPDRVKELKEKLFDWTEELTPPGFLGGDTMPETWERYYDFYLDGKLDAKPNRKESEGTEKAADWIVRNGKLKQHDTYLEIVPGKDTGARGPFIANSHVRFDGPAVARVTFQEAVAGPLSISWRNEGEKDFVSGNQASFEKDGAGEKIYKAEIPNGVSAIHIRMRFPKRGAKVKELKILSSDGTSLATWGFLRDSDSDENEPPPPQ